MTSTLRISRQQLAAFLKNDHDAIRQFETLFDAVANPDTTATATEPEIVVEVAAHEALARIERLERALQMLELEPPAYTHPTEDGYKHLPATGTTNAGKVPIAGATPGAWTLGNPEPPVSYFGFSWPIDAETEDIGWGDEFTTNTIANWTVVNSAGLDSYGVDTSGGYLYAAPNTPNGQCCGLFKPLTDTSWTVIGKLRNASYGAPYQVLGIAVRNSGNGRIACVVIAGTGSGAYCSMHTYNSPTSRNSFSDIYTSIGLGGLAFYIKVVRSDNTLTMYLSSDGRYWWVRGTLTITDFLLAVDQVGLTFGANGSSRPVLMCDWIRRTA